MMSRQQYLLLVLCLLPVTCRCLISPIVHPGKMGTLISSRVTDNTELIFQFDDIPAHLVTEGALRVYVASDHSESELPLLVVTRYTQGVLSWQLPLLVRTDLGDDDYTMTSYNSVNRTLCPSNNYPILLSNQREENRTVLVSFSTASPKEIQFELRYVAPLPLCDEIFFNCFFLSIFSLYQQETFSLRLDTPYQAKTSPSAPMFFEFQFPPEQRVVLIKVKSNDDICMTMSIQNVTCPVYDLDKNVQFEGK